jgi:hypothetical protein
MPVKWKQWGLLVVDHKTNRLTLFLILFSAEFSHRGGEFGDPSPLVPGLYS